MPKLLARLVLLPTGLIHLAICLFVLWLDKQSLLDYLDGLVRARYDLDEFPVLLVIDSRACQKDTVIKNRSGECLAKLETDTNGCLYWVGYSPKVSTVDRSLILRQSDLNEPMRMTKKGTPQ